LHDVSLFRDWLPTIPHPYNTLATRTFSVTAPQSPLPSLLRGAFSRGVLLGRVFLTGIAPPPPRAALFAPPPGHTPRRADRARVASRGHGPPRPTARRRRTPRAPGSRPPRSAPDAVGSRPSGVGRAPVVDTRSRAVAPSPHPPADPSTPHTRARRYPQVGSPAGP